MRGRGRGLLPEVVLDEAVQHGPAPGTDLEDCIGLDERQEVGEVRDDAQRPELIVERAARPGDARVQQDRIEPELSAQRLVRATQPRDVLHVEARQRRERHAKQSTEKRRLRYCV